jgi:hypothetical protein
MEIDLPLKRVGGAGIGLEDYIDDAHLPHIIPLLEKNSHRVVDKVAEWQLEAELQEKIFYDLHGSSYNDK